MKVLKVVEPNKFEFEERPVPVPTKNEALLKMHYCGICGSDVRVFTGNHPYASYPRIMGHEISAEVIQIGPDKLNPPALVSINPYFTCGKCFTCINGKQNCCLKNETMGVQRDGAYAEYIVVPTEKLITNNQLLDEKLLALTEPFAVGYHAVERTDIQRNERVLIFGAGPIGIFTMISAVNKGAVVDIADPHYEKLRITMLLGVSDIANTKENDLQILYASTYGNGYDICIDACGSKESIYNCFKFVKTGGKVIFIGHSKEEIIMPHPDIVKKELTIIASRNSLNLKATHEIIANTDMIDSVITNIVPFEEVPDFYKRLVAKDDKIVKALIKF
jgi:2-desacetyl-2-hydroxyethyl bacteriochlorophyllide A dehydrogenase